MVGVLNKQQNTSAVRQAWVPASVVRSVWFTTSVEEPSASGDQAPVSAGHSQQSYQASERVKASQPAKEGKVPPSLHVHALLSLSLFTFFCLNSSSFASFDLLLCSGLKTPPCFTPALSRPSASQGPTKDPQKDPHRTPVGQNPKVNPTCDVQDRAEHERTPPGGRGR